MKLNIFKMEVSFRFIQTVAMENSKKRQELLAQQKEFNEQVKRFEGFIRENEAKGERSDEKFFEELKLKEIDAKEFDKLKQQYKEIIPK